MYLLGELNEGEFSLFDVRSPTEVNEVANRWHALRSKPRKENILYRQIIIRGYEVFYPQIRVKPSNPRARKRKPLFPGYMFIHLDIGKVGLSIFNWMPYSLGIVCFGGEPGCVPDSLISEIRRRTESINQSRGEACLPFKHGDKVNIENGLFQGCEAVFDMSLAEGKRVKLLLELLSGQHIRIDMPSECIR
jgi:transcription antitermination factor NusG